LRRAPRQFCILLRAKPFENPKSFCGIHAL